MLFFFETHIKRWRFATTIPIQWRVGPASLESTANLGLDWRPIGVVSRPLTPSLDLQQQLWDALARSGLGGLPPVCGPSLASSSRVNRVDLPADQHPPASEEIQAQSIKTIGAGIETNEADEPALNELKASLSHPNSSHHQSTESFESCVAPNEGLIPQ
uniref:Uncharacterized protein n=1 Tax=Coccidioides posadasii RMSCC 3488 TaxID=454284 RepID=A0A0J6FKJ5_COCPO|nr:hypothetical protein CPAG_05685 [Coccidioides posadasii RMSCC 3488]